MTFSAKVHFLTVGSNDPAIHKRMLEIASNCGLVAVIPARDIFREPPTRPDGKNYRAELAANNAFTCVFADKELIGYAHIADEGQSGYNARKAEAFASFLREEFGDASVQKLTNIRVSIGDRHGVLLPEVIQVRPDKAHEYGGKPTPQWDKTVPVDPSRAAYLVVSPA